MTGAVPAFDGHNDALKRLADAGPGAVAGFLRGDGAGRLDLPRARRGGFAGGLFAFFVHTAGEGGCPSRRHHPRALPGRIVAKPS